MLLSEAALDHMVQDLAAMQCPKAIFSVYVVVQVVLPDIKLSRYTFVCVLQIFLLIILLVNWMDVPFTGQLEPWHACIKLPF